MTKESWKKDRELSWLDFNRRVLDETNCQEYTLRERFAFLTIFTKNLDEFFQVRISRMLRRGKKNEMLHTVLQSVSSLYRERDRAAQKLETLLEQNGYAHLRPIALSAEEMQKTESYFFTKIAPLLRPQIIGKDLPFPFLRDKACSLAVSLTRNGTTCLGIVPFPPVPRLYLVGSRRYLLLEDILAYYLPRLFPAYTVSSWAVFRVTRSAELDLSGKREDYWNDLKLRLEERKRLSPIRLEIEQGIDQTVLEVLLKHLQLRPELVFYQKTPIAVPYQKLFPVIQKKPSFPAPLESILKQILRRDLLYSYPYDSYGNFLKFLKETASHPSVRSIKITLYRIAAHSKVARLLMLASRNGKEVTVFLEPRARFDEQNNLHWAEKLKAAGCRVVYGPRLYKVHAKICLITCRVQGKIRTITQIGTGNYQEETVGQYTDYSLLTADQQIGRDAEHFFDSLCTGRETHAYQKLWISPFTMKEQLLARIGQEIENAKKGLPARIIIKCNSLGDKTLMRKLSEASCAGVSVHLLIRGICCLVPGIEGKTERIEVVSLVGRYLEHGRLYCFGYGDTASVYLSSADLLKRNMERRMEVCTPIEQPSLKRKLMRTLLLQLADNTKAWQMQSDGTYRRRLPLQGMCPINAQLLQDRWAAWKEKRSAERKRYRHKLLRRRQQCEGSVSDSSNCCI